VRKRAWGAATAIAAAVLCCGCSRKPQIDGRKIFLQSEAELHKVRSFRAYIVTGEDGGMVTDAQFQCDKSIAHYLETKDNPPSKTEFIATETVLFHRSADTLDVIWNAERRPANLRACTRLLDGPDRKKMGVRYFSADQERILPPFSLYATEDGATITPMGNEVVDGVSSEIWKVEDKALTIPLHTIWIGTIDRLPTKYVEGDLAKPRGTVTFSGYGDQFDIQLPRGAQFPKEAAPEVLR
jgi:hypothetical protein